MGHKYDTKSYFAACETYSHMKAPVSFVALVSQILFLANVYPGEGSIQWLKSWAPNIHELPKVPAWAIPACYEILGSESAVR